jgi:hypothetical protein
MTPLIIMMVWGAALAAPVVASAASRDSDWPCQQIKVSTLSLAAVWTGPAIDPRQADWKGDQPIVDLVQKVTPRSKPIEEAQALVHEFAQQAGNQKTQELLKVIAGVFSILDAERDSTLAGLQRFGTRQKELAAEIRKDNEKLQAMQLDPGSDPQSIQRIAQQLTWEVEVFQDRRQAIGYACDAPVKIEQRLFLLAREIQQELQ